MKMVKTLMIPMALVAVTTMAAAADLPPAYAYPNGPRVVTGEQIDYLWNGFYVGGNVGMGWINGKTNATASEIKGFPLAISPPGINAPATGALGGAQAGYNYRLNQTFVLGVEGDFDWSGMNNKWSDIWSATLPGPFGFSVQNNGQTKEDWFGTVRGRVGLLASPTFMIYGTGGLAIGEVSSSYNTGVYVGNTCVSCGGSTTSGVRYGWTAGAGMEYAINNHWSVKGEWLHYDLGTVHGNYATSGPVPFVPTYNVNWSTKVDGELARFGFNYKIAP